MAAFADLLTRDRQVCGGEPVFKGTRVTLRTVLASLADGDSIEQIVISYPSIGEQQVRAAIAFAAASAQEDLPLPELPAMA
jgi:uncharacterized protein (DUF433 family)